MAGDCPYQNCNLEGSKKSPDGKWVYNPNCDGGKVMHIKQKENGQGRTTTLCFGLDTPEAKSHLVFILGSRSQ